MQNNNNGAPFGVIRDRQISRPNLGAGAVAGAGGFGGAPAGAGAGAGAGVDYRERTPERQIFPLNPRSRQVNTPPPQNGNIFIAPPPAPVQHQALVQHQAPVQPPAPIQPPQGAVQPIANQQNLVRSIDSPPPFSPRGNQ